MKINFAAKTIEVTKTFANKASNFGSEEYYTLRTAMSDLPDFTVAIKMTRKPRRTYMKGLTCEYMESYISMVGEDGSLMKDFQCLRQGCNYAVLRWKNWNAGVRNTTSAFVRGWKKFLRCIMKLLAFGLMY